MLHSFNKKNSILQLCSKCNKTCTNESVIVINQTYHTQCFKCEDCQLSLVNCQYFIVNNHQNQQSILCESDYLKNRCCQSSPTTYQYKGVNYCRYHYSSIEKTQCSGCKHAIFSQLVEHKDYPGTIWHPECYMLYKFWNIKLQSFYSSEVPRNEQVLIQMQKDSLKRIKRVWNCISIFEESSATCISDMLFKVSTGDVLESILMAKQFVMHLEVLYGSVSKLQSVFVLYHQDFKSQEQANAICKDLIRFFEVVNLNSESLSQDLLSIVKNIAQNLKYILRLCLHSSLLLEQEFGIPNAMSDLFLNSLLELERKRKWVGGRFWLNDSNTEAEMKYCKACLEVVRDSDSFGMDNNAWHDSCFKCQSCSTQLSTTNVVFLRSNDIQFCNDCQPNTPLSKNVSYTYSYNHYIHYLKCFFEKILTEQTPSPNTNTKTQPLILRLLGPKIATPADKYLPISVEKTTGPILKSLKSPDEAISKASSPLIVGALSPTKKINQLFSQNLKRNFSTNKHNKKKTSEENKLASDLLLKNSSHVVELDSPQDLILRYSAAIQLKGLVSCRINDLIEPKKSYKKKDFWDKFFFSQKSLPTGTFGVLLCSIAQRDSSERVQIDNIPPAFTPYFSKNAMIPHFIKICVKVILQSDMSIEGVFRKNGNIKQLKAVSDSIDKSSPHQFESILTQQNSIQLAGLLKKYLRELPEPLIPFVFYDLFIQPGRHSIEKKVLHLTCCLLPKPNRDTLMLVFKCLKWVSEMSETNKMGVSNLARVIAPSVLFQSANTMNRQGAQNEINVIEILIRDIDELSQVPDDCKLLSIHDIYKSNNLSLKHLDQYQCIHKQKSKTFI